MLNTTSRRPRAVIVDVDGTLVDVTSVRHHVLNRPKNFEAFHAGAEHCPPIAATVALVEALQPTTSIIIVTARMRQWEASTVRWLNQHRIPRDAVHMRADGDSRPDFEIKAEILATIRETHDVILAIDDNPSVIALWESEGIPTVTVPGWAAESADPPQLIEERAEQVVQFMVRGPLGTREVPSGESWTFEERPVGRRIITRTTEWWLGHHPDGQILPTGPTSPEISEVVRVDEGPWEASA